MFIRFLHQLKEAGVPVSIREYLDFLAGLDKGITNLNTDSFYHFARASLVKDERHYDRFDRTFSEFFELEDPLLRVYANIAFELF